MELTQCIYSWSREPVEFQTDYQNEDKAALWCFKCGMVVGARRAEYFRNC